MVKRKPPAGTRDDRVAAIAAFMSAGNWFGSHERKAFAKRWALTENYVSEIACDASKRVLAEVTDPDRVKSDVSRALQKVIEDGIANGDPRSMSNVVKAADVLSKILGVAAAQKFQVAGVSLDDIDAMRRTAEGNESGKSG